MEEEDHEDALIEHSKIILPSNGGQICSIYSPKDIEPRIGHTELVGISKPENHQLF